MEVLKKYFSEFTPEQERQLAGLKHLYEEWNERINVISRKDMDNFYIHHVLHSLAIAAKFNFEDHTEVMDLGTGGGFPGLPLAIFFPHVSFHLVDSIHKKLQVVTHVAAKLDIFNVSTEHTRAEDIRNRQFDVVVSRAVAPLKDLWHWSKPLIRLNRNTEGPNGLICLKGGDLSEEISQSGCKPFVWEIEKIFSEPYFKEKFILYQPLKK